MADGVVAEVGGDEAQPQPAWARVRVGVRARVGVSVRVEAGVRVRVWVRDRVGAWRRGARGARLGQPQPTVATDAGDAYGKAGCVEEREALAYKGRGLGLGLGFPPQG